MAGTCVVCHHPLVITVSSDEDEGTSGRVNTQTVPDSVKLSCGCQFHWECLLDAYAINDCPNCNANAITISDTGAQQVLCTLENEGGVQENLDIMALWLEASYLKTYPEERRCRAWIELAAEGDAIAMVDLLCDSAESDDEAGGQRGGPTIDEIIVYQDPLCGMKSALHVAVQHQEEVVAWLLLWLFSILDANVFPAEISQTAEEVGMSRRDVMAWTDIRNLKDSEGVTAAELAESVGEDWVPWVQAGWLKPPRR